MVEDNCVFCNYENIKGDVLEESGNFFIKVGKGILAPGHVMVITKKHEPCFGALSSQLLDEFEHIKKNLIDNLKNKFSEPIVHEHGNYSQTINHAHMHFIPKKNELYDLSDFVNSIFLDLNKTEIHTITSLFDIFNKEGSYLYLEENNQKWIFHTKGLPDGKYTFRKEFARLTGFHNLMDWRNISKEDQVRNDEWVNLTKQAWRQNG